MRHGLIGFATAVLAAGSADSPSARSALAARDPARQRPRATRAVRAVAGCYRLTVEAPATLLGRLRARWGSEVPLPAVVRLDTIVQRTFGRGTDFRASPDVVDYHEFPSAPGWRLASSDSLVVSWFDGFYGTTVHLRGAGARWVGATTYATDDEREPARPSRRVVATRVACPASPTTGAHLLRPREALPHATQRRQQRSSGSEPAASRLDTEHGSHHPSRRAGNRGRAESRARHDDATERVGSEPGGA